MMALRSRAAPALALAGAMRGISTVTLPDLPYDYGALSPVIIPEIMELHHKKHHQAYVTNLNKALEQHAEAERRNDLKAMIALQPAIKFNGGGELGTAWRLPTRAKRSAGPPPPTTPACRLTPAAARARAGHINHSMFWEMLTPPQDYQPPAGKLAAALEADFGSLDAFTSTFAAAAAGVQGSGWGWLALSKATGKLVVATTANQDPLQPTTGLVPLLGVDVWEHAYVSAP
jgi:Fe-Mn family superoxide dismutase